MAENGIKAVGLDRTGYARPIRTDVAGTMAVNVTEKLINTLYKHDPVLLLDFASDSPYVNVIDSHISFSPNNAQQFSIAKGGFAGKCLSIPENSTLKQNAVYKNENGSSVSTYFPKVATYLGQISCHVGVVTAYLSPVGNITTTKVKLVLYTDNSGVPGVPWTDTHQNYPTYDTDVAPYIGGTALNAQANWGLPLTRPCVCVEEKAWLVMEYEDATGIDASNYVGWGYETSNTYATGGKRATYDGTTWTVTDGQNHRFALYEPVFPDGDFTILTSVKHTGNRSAYLTRMPGFKDGEAVATISLAIGPTGRFYATINDGAMSNLLYDSVNRTNEWTVVALTFSKEKSRGKCALYLNGELLAEKIGINFALDMGAMGKGGNPIYPASQPFVIGIINEKGVSGSNGLVGSMGFYALVKKELSRSEIKEINAIARGR